MSAMRHAFLKRPHQGLGVIYHQAILCSPPPPHSGLGQDGRKAYPRAGQQQHLVGHVLVLIQLLLQLFMLSLKRLKFVE